jgi:hypothetical protein
VLGVIAAVGGYPGAFIAAGAAAFLALVLLRTWLSPWLERRTAMLEGGAAAG